MVSSSRGVSVRLSTYPDLLNAKNPVSHYLEILEKLKGLKVLVVGDCILDVYHFGRVDRLSPEAPVPIFIEDLKKIEARRGGADNVAHQLEVLGCEVETHITKFPSVKHRYMVGHHQLLRVDYDSDSWGDPFKESLEGYSAVVLSDYNKGFLTYTLCQQIIKEARKYKIPVVVDPKGTEWSKYGGASIICPNEKEWKAVELLEPEGMDIVAKYGEIGLTVKFSGANFTKLIPAQAKQVFDVTGAGDTVVAVVAACVGAGASLEDAAYIANAAAGWTVGELGTKVCPLDKLKELL
jgi:D-beta-D-heptose 7-phosphate kinase/D-beta-D-heptose 1-phosphate adenosyltransferase